jgi:hypothetical protein
MPSAAAIQGLAGPSAILPFLEFLDDLRAQLKAGTFWPLPVRERKIPSREGRGS